jgi:hypothetical protein
MASCSSGHFDVFVRGSDNQIYQEGFNGVSWGGWGAIGGNWTSGPSAVCEPGTSTVGVFAGGIDNALWSKSVAAS